MMADMGAGGFAERARIELEATGGPARKRGTGTAAALTPRESQIARLASGGLANRDIAAQLSSVRAPWIITCARCSASST